MIDTINTYRPCAKHEKMHSEQCIWCEVDALRDLLREVSNSFAFKEVACEPSAVMVRLKADLWKQIEPLRLNNKREG